MPGETESSGLVANHKQLGRLLEVLLEPNGRTARRQAAEAIRDATLSPQP
jgi:hypothetical protein